MSQTDHVEKHFTAGEIVRDVVIGMSDGLTVPFALAAGLSGAVAQTNLVITAGLAEVAAGSIAMGLGGYLAARSDAEHYQSEYRREMSEIAEIPEQEKAEVVEILQSYGLTAAESQPIVESLAARPADFADFMMRFELGLEEPAPRRALHSALTIAGSYVAGGLIPLAPYFFAGSVHQAFLVSVFLTLAALLVFGFVKGKFTGANPARSSLQTALIGSLAATAAYLIAHAIA